MSLASLIADEILNDDEDQTDRLIAEYQSAPPEAQTAIDGIMICLCGWSLSTLIKQYENNRGDEE